MLSDTIFSSTKKGIEQAIEILARYMGEILAGFFVVMNIIMTLLLFFARPRLPLRNQLALAREDQIQRMYPSMHARMEGLRRRNT